MNAYRVCVSKDKRESSTDLIPVTFILQTQCQLFYRLLVQTLCLQMHVLPEDLGN